MAKLKLKLTWANPDDEPALDSPEMRELVDAVQDFYRALTPDGKMPPELVKIEKIEDES